MRYGFELEGFFRGKEGEVALPPRHYTTDCFPGLCEVRTSGGNLLAAAYFELLKAYTNQPFDTQTFEATFTPAQRQELRGRIHMAKDPVYIKNIYNKTARALGNRTLASFQINVSLQIFPERTIKGVQIPARYALFDVCSVVRAFDKEFEKEIKASNRQPGFYAVKENVRLEYRSLPNTVFESNLAKVPALLARIQKCVESV